MRSLVAYQFLPARKPAVIGRLLRQLPTQGARAILDLEDSAADVIEPERTAELKRAARENLAAFFSTGGAPTRQALAVRVNAGGTPHHLADLTMVADALEAGHDVAVVLPKVESAAEVLAAAGFFTRRGLAAPRLFPILETGLGVERGRETLAAARHVIGGVVLGMIDYAFDQSIWPFPGPLDSAVWRIARHIAGLCDEAGVAYVHPPSVWLREPRLIREVRRRVRAICRGPAGMITLSLLQTRAVLDEEDDDGPGDVTDRRPTDPVEEARLVVRQFREHHTGTRSFSVSESEDRFIPPHEYLAAIRFLERYGGGA
jgi:citrate lyase beta subunit